MSMKLTCACLKPVIDEELTNNPEPTWRAMEFLVDSGRVRAIGVSNFNASQLERLHSFARIKPACNQVESHPYLPQTELLNFCKQNHIAFAAYSPLGSQSGPSVMHTRTRILMEDETIVAVANELGVHQAQILIAWASK
jgi:diketogulonate reductase-like aldo/keto reductase